jgi:outer membrane protein TolC
VIKKVANGYRKNLSQKLMLIVFCLIFLFPICGSGIMAEESSHVYTLTESIALAVEKSKSIDSAAKKVEQAQLEKEMAFKSFLPTLSASYSYTRLDDDPEMSTYKIENIRLTPTVTIPVITGQTRAQVGTRDNWEAKLTLTQPIFTGFKLVNRHELADLGVDLAKIYQAQEELDLVLKVKEAYFNILRANKSLEVARQAIKQVEAHLNVVQKFFKSGMSTKNQVLEAEVRLAEALQENIRAENAVLIAKANFNTLLSRPIGESVKLEDILKYEIFGPNFTQCMQIAFESRPEIQSVKNRIEAARNQIDVSRGEYYPFVGLSANHYWKGDTWEVDGSDYMDDNTSWDVSVSLSWEFWSWGKSLDKVSKDQIELARISNALTQLKDEIRLEVNRSYLSMKEAEKNIPVARKAIEQAEENFRMNEARYLAQVGTSTDVIDASTLLASAHLNYYNALYGYKLSQAALERAMGRRSE